MELSENAKDLIRGYDQSISETISIFQAAPLNPKSYSMVKNSANAFYEELEGFEPEDKLDTLVEKELRTRTRANEVFADYVSGNSEMETPEVVDTIYGDGTYEKIFENFANRDFEQDLQEKKLRKELNYKSLDGARSDLPLDVRDDYEFVEDIVEQWKYVDDTIPQGFELETTPIDFFRDNRAKWDSWNEEANIGLESLRILNTNGEIRLDAAKAIEAMFHEAYGHGVHHWIAQREAPELYSRQADRSIGTRAHKEAIALMRSDQAKKVVDNHQDSLPVNEISVELMKSKGEDMARQVFPPLVRNMEVRGEIESASEVIQNCGYSEKAAHRLLKNGMDESNALMEASYSGARALMEEIDIEKREFEDLCKVDWSPQVLPEALDYFEEQGA